MLSDCVVNRSRETKKVAKCVCALNKEMIFNKHLERGQLAWERLEQRLMVETKRVLLVVDTTMGSWGRPSVEPKSSVRPQARRRMASALRSWMEPGRE